MEKTKKKTCPPREHRKEKKCSQFQVISDFKFRAQQKLEGTSDTEQTGTPKNEP